MAILQFSDMKRYDLCVPNCHVCEACYMEKPYIILIYIYKSSVMVSEISKVTQFLVTRTAKYRALTRSMNVIYVLGHA
jgi:hypothetical protein